MEFTNFEFSNPLLFNHLTDSPAYMLFLAISEWASFFGRFHPLLVHLPIGFLMLAGVFEILRITGRLAISQDTLKVILLVSALGATLACVAGYLLSLEGGYNEKTLEQHKLQGIWLAVFCWLAWLSKLNWLNERVGAGKLIYTPALLLSLILMITAGHQGGNLTHGETYLTDNTPQPFRSWLGMPEKTERKNGSIEEQPKIQNIDEAQVYQDIVRPILKQKCDQCHNSSKMKGELRLDDIDLFKKGGKHGVVFIAHNAEGSEFIKRILLPESEDEHMPPKGKSQITENELALLKWWIEQGAPFDKKVSEVKTNEIIKPILATLGGAQANTNRGNTVAQDNFEIEEKLLSAEVRKINDAVANDIRKTGALILPFAQNSNYIEISYTNNSKLADEEVSGLSKAAEQTLWLRLSNTQITDKALEEISKFSKLTRLHLEYTKVSDIGLYRINPLISLEYLNLTGNKITDSGLNNLSGLKNLKKLYLWKTEVTPKGADELRKSLPNLKIELGMNEQEIADFLNAKPNEVSDDLYKKK